MKQLFPLAIAVAVAGCATSDEPEIATSSNPEVNEYRQERAQLVDRVEDRRRDVERRERHVEDAYDDIEEAEEDLRDRQQDLEAARRRLANAERELRILENRPVAAVSEREANSIN